MSSMRRHSAVARVTTAITKDPMNPSCRLTRWASASGFALAVLIVPALPVAQTTLSVVMSGLDSPRGLAFGPEGALYVTEAGRGAGIVASPATDPRCFPGPA